MVQITEEFSEMAFLLQIAYYDCLAELDDAYENNTGDIAVLFDKMESAKTEYLDFVTEFDPTYPRDALEMGLSREFNKRITQELRDKMANDILRGINR